MENQREIKKLAAEFKALIAGGRNVLDPWCYYFKRRISRRNFVLRHDYTSMFARLLASPECIADMKINHDPQTNIVTFLGTEEMLQDAEEGNLDMMGIIACGLHDETRTEFIRAVARNTTASMSDASPSQRERRRRKVIAYLQKVCRLYDAACVA